MKKSLIIIISIIGLIVIAGGIWYYSNFKKYAPTVYVTETETGTTTVNTSTGTETPGSPTYTLAQVGEHKDASSCYSVIGGSVYDLTMWVNMHPGGKGAILSLCGTDGTARFSAKHGGDARPTTILARYKIGALAN